MTKEEALSRITAKGKAIQPRLFLGHYCGGCKVYVGYVFIGDDLFYDSSCGCSSFGSSPRRAELDGFLDRNPTRWDKFVAEVEAL